MNNFRKQIKVEQGNMQNIVLKDMTEKQRLAYEEYKRKRFAKEVQKPIWKGEER